MRTSHLCTICGLLLTCLTSPAIGRDIDRAKSVGYAEAIGGPKGLALGVAIGDLHVEAIMGGSYFSGNSTTQATFVAAGLGAHYHLLRAQHATLATGFRLNVGSGSEITVNESSLGLETQIRSKDIVQWGLDVPLRIYWFPANSISLHTEFGVAIFISPKEGQVFEQNVRNGFSLQPGETLIRLFEGGNAFGRIGLTFWW